MSNERKKLYCQISFQEIGDEHSSIVFTQEMLISSYLNDKLTIEQLCKKYYLSNIAVKKILKNNNVNIRQPEQRSKIKKINQYTKDDIFIMEHKSYNNLAIFLNKKIETVYQNLNKKQVCWGYKWEIVYNQYG